jgi:xanthine dehydrogenase accessory factor
MPETVDIVDCMTAMRGDHQPFAVATVVRTEDATAAKAGARAVIRADGSVVGWIGGGCALVAVRKAAARALLDGKARMIRVRPAARAGEDSLPGVEYYVNSCASEGVIELFVEPVLPKPVLLVAGASPTARALADLGRRLGFAVSVAAQTGDLAQFDSADSLSAGFDLAGVPRLAEAFIVVATQGKRDREALRAALASPAPYVAFIGSRRKAATLSADLAGEGLEPAMLARLRSPAGLDLGAATPEEIALSVLAEITLVRRRGDQAATVAAVSASQCAEAGPAKSCCDPATTH